MDAFELEHDFVHVRAPPKLPFPIDLLRRPYNSGVRHCDTLWGLGSVDDIYRLLSAHTENNREPGVHCNKNDINGIKLCLSFSQGLKFQDLYFLNALASGGVVHQITCRGFTHGSHYTDVPRPVIWPQLHILYQPLFTVSHLTFHMLLHALCD